MAETKNSPNNSPGADTGEWLLALSEFIPVLGKGSAAGSLAKHLVEAHSRAQKGDKIGSSLAKLEALVDVAQIADPEIPILEQAIDLASLALLTTKKIHDAVPKLLPTIAGWISKAFNRGSEGESPALSPQLA